MLILFQYKNKRSLIRVFSIRAFLWVLDPFSRYNDEIWKKKRTKFAVGRKNRKILSRKIQRLR